MAHLSWQGRGIDYLTYVAPGLLAYATFMTAIFQALFAAFIRMRYQRTWLPTIDHMNLPVFLLVLPMGLMSATYFPLEHPALVALSLVNPLYHLAQAFRGVLLGGPVMGHLVGLAILAAVMLGVLVPLDLRLLRRRVLGE